MSPLPVMVAFYCRFSFHAAMLRRAYEICRANGQIETMWAVTDEELIGCRPRIVVTAGDIPDEVRALLPEDCPIIFTRHGFSSKNHLRYMLERCDVICVSSQWAETDIKRRFGKNLPRFWITGFTPTDEMWLSVEKASRHPRPRTVLYAPTWNEELTAPEVIGTQWAIEWLKPGGRRLLVKPHPLRGNPRVRDWLEGWVNLSRGSDGQILILHPDTNIYAVMPEADVLVTDTSSVMFYWLALDRPIVLVDPSPSKDNAFFDAEGPEWTWRDMGHRVGDPAGLTAALEDALVRPGLHARQREKYRARVFGNLFDGKASERLAARIHRLAADLPGRRAR